MKVATKPPLAARQPEVEYVSRGTASSTQDVPEYTMTENRMRMINSTSRGGGGQSAIKRVTKPDAKENVGHRGRHKLFKREVNFDETQLSNEEKLGKFYFPYGFSARQRRHRAV